MTIRRYFLEIGWTTASFIAISLAIVILAATPTVAFAMLGGVAYYLAGGDLVFAAVFWLPSALFGISCVYRPYISPLTRHLFGEILSWNRQEERSHVPVMPCFATSPNDDSEEFQKSRSRHSD